MERPTVTPEELLKETGPEFLARGERRAAQEAPPPNGANDYDATSPGDAVGAPVVIKATPFAWIEPASIPRRKWLYGRHYIRDFVSQTVAPGGYGKSSLVLVETLAIAVGLPLLGVKPDESVPAWYWNGEDPGDELDRRIISAALRHGVDRSQLEGRLFVDNWPQDEDHHCRTDATRREDRPPGCRRGHSDDQGEQHRPHDDRPLRRLP